MEKQNNSPIGLFDSGIGGTSIWSAIHSLLPNESSIYLADSKNAPYGIRSKEEIIQLCCKNTELLLELDAKLIVVACNTATTNAIKELREKYDVPFIGIEPAIKPAATNSKTQKIGILATKGTLNSELFNRAVKLHSDVRIVEQIGHGLVQLIEAGIINSDEMHELLLKYMQPMIDADVDYLVLGCSHFPYLIPQLAAILPSHVTIIDSGEAVAKQTQNILSKIGFADGENSTNVFYTNGNPVVLKSILPEGSNVMQKEF